MAREDWHAEKPLPDEHAWRCALCGQLSLAKRRPRFHRRVIRPADPLVQKWRSVRCGPFQLVHLVAVDSGPRTPDSSIGWTISEWDHEDRDAGIHPW